MMVSDLLLTTERLRSEKKFLSNMIIKLVGENQQLLRENKHFREEIRSLQYPQQYTKRMLEGIDMEDSQKIKQPKAIKQQDKLFVSRVCDSQHAKQQDCLRKTMVHHTLACCNSALTSDSARSQHYQLSSIVPEQCLEHELGRISKVLLETHLQYCEKMEGKKGEFFKEQLHMLETRSALTEQGKYIERLQMKINHLQDELKNAELRATIHCTRADLHRQIEELRKEHCGSWMYEVDMDHLGSQMNRTGKKSYVCIWQKGTGAKRPEDDTKSTKKKTEILEKVSPEVCQLPKTNLSNGWLEASINNIKNADLKVARENVLDWLQASIESLKEKGPKASKQSLEEWLKECFKNLEIECPEASRRDVKEWLKVSISHLREEGPDTSHLSVQEWLEVSVKSIQDLKEQQTYKASKMNEIEGSEKEKLIVPPCSRSSINKRWLETSIENLKARGSKLAIENVQEWLQSSMKNLIEQPSEASGKNLQEWLKAAIQNFQKECPETSRQDVKEWLVTSIQNLQEKGGPETCYLTVQEWHEESLKGLQVEASKQNMQEFSEPSTRILQKEQTEPSIKTIEEQCPEATGEDVKESPEASTKTLQEGSTEISQPTVQERHEPYLESNQEKGFEASKEKIQESFKTQTGGHETSKLNLGKSLQASLKSKGDVSFPVQQNDQEWLETSIKGPQDKETVVSRQNLQEFPKASVKEQEVEGAKSSMQNGQEWLGESTGRFQNEVSRINVQKWLESSMKTLEEAGSDISKQSLQKWLEASMQNLNEICPKAARHDVKEWLETSIMNLKEQGLDTSKVSVQEWLQASIESLGKEGHKESIADVKKWWTADTNNYLGKITHDISGKTIDYPLGHHLLVQSTSFATAETHPDPPSSNSAA
ncbi:hypothetical protein JD844_002635 [Phrynosoma platyrhinos]|uniref:Uncharacterized protein n=1 Tax=Phrynosoma platyrhinos TaxID=52577 RepID=A0ABQ7TBT3_PHRPL|nr:hypothetical protein JD844_002635 [Phrynosoma platyrhinos]